MDLAIGKVSILTLSADSSTLVASVGAVDLLFFSVNALLNKVRVCLLIIFFINFFKGKFHLFSPFTT